MNGEKVDYSSAADVAVLNAAVACVQNKLTVPMPPDDWTCPLVKPAPQGRTPVTAAKNAMVAERRRLTVWETLVALETGKLLHILDEVAGAS